MSSWLNFSKREKIAEYLVQGGGDDECPMIIVVPFSPGSDDPGYITTPFLSAFKITGLVVELTSKTGEETPILEIEIKPEFLGSCVESFGVAEIGAAKGVGCSLATAT